MPGLDMQEKFFRQVRRIDGNGYILKIKGQNPPEVDPVPTSSQAL